jgi:O-antigen ligase
MAFNSSSQSQFTPDFVFRLMLEWLTLFCGVVLVLVWPIEGTIAARNIALILGCLTSLLWIIFYRPQLSLLAYLPQLCLLAVPLWLWAHYFLLSTDIVAQIYDLQGTWVRVILGVVLATGLGLMISKRMQYQFWLWAAMVALAVAALAMYLNGTMTTEQLLIPGFRAIFKYKSAVVYFLMWPCMLAYALLHLKLIEINEKKPLSWLHLLGCFLLLGSCWAIFIAAQALNGVLIAGFMGAVLVTLLLRHSIVSYKVSGSRKWFLLLLIVSMLAVTLITFWNYDKKHEQKLINLIGDARIASQIDKHSAWQRDPTVIQPSTPNNETGRPINGSTYERVAWFVKGVQLLTAHPEGAGFSHRAFRYFMHQENPNFNVNKTHSGWLDFALGVGVPGVILTWIAIALVVRRALSNAASINAIQIRELALITLWMIAGIWFLWWPTEVSEREFIEYFYFMIALLAAINCAVPKKIQIA